MRMIVIVDHTPNVEQPLRAIEEIPEETEPDDVFDEWIKETGYDEHESGRMGYMFIHPVFGALIQSSEVPGGGDSICYAMSEYRMTLCKMIEVEPEFSITHEECLTFYAALKNRWVATAQ